MSSQTMTQMPLVAPMSHMMKRTMRQKSKRGQVPRARLKIAANLPSFCVRNALANGPSS